MNGACYCVVKGYSERESMPVVYMWIYMYNIDQKQGLNELSELWDSVLIEVCVWKLRDELSSALAHANDRLPFWVHVHQCLDLSSFFFDPFWLHINARFVCGKLRKRPDFACLRIGEDSSKQWSHQIRIRQCTVGMFKWSSIPHQGSI